MRQGWSLIVAEDGYDFAKKAAQHVREQLRARPESVLALPTGKTPLKMYDELAQLCERGEADFSRSTAFNLDELYSLQPDHSASYASYLQTHFFSRIPVGRAVLFDGITADIERECLRIEREVQLAGELDLAIVGIGRNGHIAFNEPGSRCDSTTRLVWLTESSRRTIGRTFPADEEVPYTALTMGMSTILRSRSILLLAAGPEKAGVLACALTGRITDEIPASFLRIHHCLTIIADREAAARLS